MPTTAWPAHQAVVDSQRLPLPELKPGRYRLVGGWYYPVTGDRLPVTVNDRPAGSGDVAELGVIVVE